MPNLFPEVEIRKSLSLLERQYIAERLTDYIPRFEQYGIDVTIDFDQLRVRFSPRGNRNWFAAVYPFDSIDFLHMEEFCSRVIDTYGSVHGPIWR